LSAKNIDFEFFVFGSDFRAIKETLFEDLLGRHKRHNHFASVWSKSIHEEKKIKNQKSLITGRYNVLFREWTAEIATQI
jgi:hypothetical protein